MSRLVLNRIQTPDGTILTSYHRHDYITHLDKNGEEYMVDGGLDYTRRNLNIIPPIDLSVYDDADFDTIRKSFHRFNSRTGEYTLLCDMSDEWLDNLLTYLDEYAENKGVGEGMDEFPFYLYKKEKRERELRKLA